MVQEPGRTHVCVRQFLLLSALIIGAGIACTSGVTAQTNYTCFPTCSETDGRMLSMASTNLNTLSGQEILLTVVSPSTSSTLEIGIFDGETGKTTVGGPTGGRWDIGSVQLIYTLFADPDANGTGTTQVAEWSGDSMPDNGWFNAVVNNNPAARTASGAYYYVLRVRTPDIGIQHWSNFKVRTDGVVFLRPGQTFSITAPLPNVASAQIVYPSWPSTATTTYDGSWSFYLYVPAPLTDLTIWDGDLDFGDFECISNDVDDEDTPGGGLPAFVPPSTSAVPEGIAQSAIHCANGDTATANPTDDSQSPVLRRSPNVYYEIVDPDGVAYVNGNPSGNLEWEQFHISTQPFDRATMDYHADALPAGTYQLNVYGMDLQNLDAFRFPQGGVGVTPFLMGVDTAGSPVIPPPPVAPDTASVSGKVYFDLNSDGFFNTPDFGIASITVEALVDYDNDNTPDETLTTITDEDGNYEFSRLRNATVTLVVDSTEISTNAVPTGDPDGTGTRSSATVTIDAAHQVLTGKDFGYHQNLSAVINGMDTLMASTNSTYTSTVNEPGVTYAWTISGPAGIVGASDEADVDIHTNTFGTFTLTLTISKNGSVYKAKKQVVVIGVDFVLFAYKDLEYDGRCDTDTTRGQIYGNVGVNQPATGGCRTAPNLTIGNSGCSSNPAFLGDGTRIMGDYVDLSRYTNYWDLYANRQTGSTSLATKRGTGPTPFALPVFNCYDLPRIPSFTYNSNNISVGTNQTRTLAPGRYGNITVNSGGVLNLQSGIYNIKSLRGYNNATINTQTGTKVRISRDLIIATNGYVGPDNGALFIVRSDGVNCGAPTVSFGCSSEFHGQVLAPNGTITLGTSNDLTGRFWGYRINGGCNTNVTYWSPVALNTRYNNDGFQKKLLGQAVTGDASASMMKQSYPNPFRSSTTVGLMLNAESTVTLRVMDASGKEVRTLLEGAVVAKGETSYNWDGRGYVGDELPSGTYFFYLQVGDHVETMPVVLAR